MSVESTKIIIPPNMKHVMADAQKDLEKNNLENLDHESTIAMSSRPRRCKREEISVPLVPRKRKTVGGERQRDDAPPRAAGPKIRRGYFGRGPRTNVPDRRSLVTAPRSARTMSMCYVLGSSASPLTHTSRSPTQPHRPRPLGGPDAGCSQRSMAAGLLRARMLHLSPTCT
jgi:hypothetical protein